MAWAVAAFSGGLTLADTITYGAVGEIHTHNNTFAVKNISPLASGVNITQVVLQLGDDTWFDTVLGTGESVGDGAFLTEMSEGDGKDFSHNFSLLPSGFSVPVDTGDPLTLAGLTLTGGIAGVVEGRTAELSFTGFGPGDSYGFYVDYDELFADSRKDSLYQAEGGDMLNAWLSVEFSNGRSLSYKYELNTKGGKVSFPFEMASYEVPEGAVPEPSVLAGLIGMGLFGALGWRRRKPAANHDR